MGWSQEFQLRKALLLYGETSHNFYPYRRPFATLHDVVHENGEARLSAAQLLTREGLFELLSAITPPAPIEVLPEYVIVRARDTIVWWAPAQTRKMFYSERGQDRTIRQLNGKEYPQPPLLFKADETHLWIRALTVNRRPTSQSKTYMAPYWNCYDNGSVCTGTMKIPTAKNAAVLIRQWEDSFFNSAFSHAAGISKHTSFPGGVLALWKSLQGKTRFPLRYLLLVDETVEQFVSTHDTTYRNQHRA